MGLRDEILEQPAAAAAAAGRGADGIRPDRRRGQVAPAAVRRHRRPRHLGQRRLYAQYLLAIRNRLDRRPGGAVDDHALRGAPGHGRRAGHRHLAVGPLAGHRRRGRRGAAPGRADRRADQRRGFAAGRHGRPRGRPARRPGAGDGRDQDLHDRAARGGAAVDGARPALVERNGRPGAPARPDVGSADGGAARARPGRRRTPTAQRAVVLGRGYGYASAREWALKLQEMALVAAMPYSTADFEHGPLALAEPGFPVLGGGPERHRRSTPRSTC